MMAFNHLLKHHMAECTITVSLSITLFISSINDKFMYIGYNSTTTLHICIVLMLSKRCHYIYLQASDRYNGKRIDGCYVIHER